MKKYMIYWSDRRISYVYSDKIVIKDGIIIFFSNDTPILLAPKKSIDHIKEE